MKSEVFNGSRFWNYFKYDLVQMWRNHMKAAMGIGLSGVIIYFLVVLFNLVFSGAWCGPNVGIRIGTFICAGVLLHPHLRLSDLAPQGKRLAHDSGFRL